MWGWALLPVLLAIWGTVGFWVVYAMSVANGSVNVTVGFPYISTCGSDPPQSCIFSQVLNVGAFLGAPAEPGWRVGSEGHRRSRAGGGCGSGVRGTAQAVALDSGSVFALHGLGLRSEAAACEWTLALTLFLLFGLFAVDFRHIQSCSVRLQRRAPAPALELGATSTQTLAL
nr:modulator of macroautophagy TMEM150B [Chrysemys picta bellii]